jgi:hypothetical protein
MQKQNSIDDLFRRELADYKVTPSDERRQAFLRDAAKEAGKRSAKRWWITGLGTGLLITAGVGLWILEESPVEKATEGRHENNNVKIFENITPKKTDKNISIEKKLIEGKENPVVKATGRKPEPRIRMNYALTVSQPSGLRGHHEPVASNTAPSGQAKVAANVQSIFPEQVQETGIKSPVKQSAPEKQPVEQSVPATAPLQENEKKILPETRNEEKVPKHRGKSSLPGNWNISTGVYYSPEWMFNTLNGDKYANNMGIEGTFHFGRYSVRTGVGLSITTGSNEILVQTNPYLGSYNVLDSIGFRWNDKHTSLIPTLYTSSANAYDTTLRYNYSYMKKRYTYLQVPLLLGYDFWQNNWLSLGMRAGAVMSVLLKTENMSATYDPGKDRIISINNISPDRIQLNWQAVGGINAAFRLSRRYSIELEPDVKYYFNSVYESSTLTRKPWSVGVRAAFLITF